jgi:hypothetical protein
MAIVLDGTNGVTTNSGTLISATTIGVGGATPSTSGAGITFPATASASSNANTLDDYEEGTWTPTVYGGTTAGTTTYTAQRGFYTKIGRAVTITFDVGYSAATGTGVLYIGGSPFTSSALGNGAQYTGSVMTNNLNMPNAGSYALYNSGGSVQLEIYSSTDDAALNSIVLSNETATIWGTLTYFV